MNEVSDIVLQFPALRGLKDISKTLLSDLDDEKTLTITVKFSARGKNTDEKTFQQFLKTKLEEKRAESPSCFTLQSIAVVTQDDPVSLPSLKKKKVNPTRNRLHHRTRSKTNLAWMCKSF